MDALGMRNVVHQQLKADDTLVVTMVHTTVGDVELIVEIGDRGPHANEDRYEVTIRRRDHETDHFSATGPDLDTATRNAWSKASSYIH
ncbi:hypothetical protein [Nocardioides sp. NPDC127503]|uniref:hypothetical protein n=1 Tax=Nocardioides sp. NPDC127503 TaxID=3154516 RepID=UPI0033190203